MVAYLLALKCLELQKVWLLRGNHETRDVNGWEEHYGDEVSCGSASIDLETSWVLLSGRA